MLYFTGEEADLINELMQPLMPSCRADFLQRVADQYASCPSESRGLGLLHRIATAIQGDFPKVNSIAVGRGGNKYGQPSIRRRSVAKEHV